MIPLPGIDIKGNGGGGAVVPPPGAEIKVNVVGEGCPGVDIEGNGGGRGIVGAVIKASVTPPAVTIENRRGEGVAPPHAVGIENGREGSPLLMQLSLLKTEVGAPPHAIGVENRREEGQGVVAIENEREEGVGAKEVPPAKHHILSS